MHDLLKISIKDLFNRGFFLNSVHKCGKCAHKNECHESHWINPVIFSCLRHFAYRL